MLAIGVTSEERKGLVAHLRQALKSLLVVYFFDDYFFQGEFARLVEPEDAREEVAVSVHIEHRTVVNCFLCEEDS